jgi:hypothetical protein
MPEPIALSSLPQTHWEDSVAALADKLKRR